MVVDLVFNLMIFMGLGSFSCILEKLKIKKTLRNTLQGLLFGLIIMIGMKYAYVFSSNTIIDCRSLGIIICTLFYGPYAGLITSLIAVTNRYFLVGPDGFFFGIQFVIESYILSLFFYFRNYREGIKTIKLIIVWLLSFFSGLSQLILFFFFKDVKLAKEALEILPPMLIILFPLGAVFVAYIIKAIQQNESLCKSIAQQERYYRHMFYNVEDLLMVVDSKKKVLNMNKAAERITGYSESELKGNVVTNYLNIYDLATDEKMPSVVDMVLATKKPVRISSGICIHSKEGKVIPICLSITPFHFKDTDVVDCVFILGDDSGSILAKENDKIEFATVEIDNFDSAVIIMDEKKNILRVNNAAMELFQKGSTKFTEKDIELLIKSIGEHCFDDVIKYHSHSFTYTQKFPDGKLLVSKVALFKALHLSENAIVAVIIDISNYADEISKAHQSIDNFTMIFENLPSNLIFQSIDGTILKASSKFANLLGYKSEELVGKNIESFVNSIGLMNVKSINNQNEKNLEVHAKCIAKDGSIVVAKMKERLLRFSNGGAGILTEVNVCEPSEKRMF
jgi:PAS domain S-box/PAS domain S-box